MTEDEKVVVFLVVLPLVIAIAIFLGIHTVEKCNKLRDGCNNEILSNCIDYEHQCAARGYK